MSKIYVDEILPKENAQISAPNLQLPAGSVIQTVTDQYSHVGTTITTQDTWTNVGRTISITPTSTNSKIVLMHYAGGMALNDPASIGLRVLRNGSLTNIFQSRHGYHSATNFWGSVSFTFVGFDEPNSTAEQTYQIQLAMQNGSSQIRYNSNTSSFGSSNLAVDGHGTVQFILQEIAQ